MANTALNSMTEMADPQPGDMLYALDDPAGTPADRKLKAGHFLPPCRPYFLAATPYNATHLSILGGGALTANVLYMGIVHVPYSRSHTKLSCNVTALQGTSGIRLGIYNLNQITLQPLTLIEACAIIDSSAGTGATGQKEQTITQTLAPGFYGLACVTDGTPSIVRGDVSRINLGVNLVAATTRQIFGIHRNFNYAALPADETAQTYSASDSGSFSAVPLLGIR